MKKSALAAGLKAAAGHRTVQVPAEAPPESWCPSATSHRAYRRAFSSRSAPRVIASAG